MSSPSRHRPALHQAGHRGIRVVASRTAPSGLPGRPRPTVVVGFDATPASRAALTYAAAWAHREGAHSIHLAVVYVEPMDGMGLVNAIAAALHLPGAAPRDMRAEAAHAVAAVDVPAGWTYLTPMGSIAEQLTAVADQVVAEAIIVGRSRRSPRALRTSVARQLAASPHRTTIVVA